MPVPSAEPTNVFDVSCDTPTTSFVPGGRVPRSGFDEELRRLLRSRLIFVHLLALAFTILLTVLSYLIPTGGGEAVFQFSEAYWWAMLAAQLAEGLIGTLVLWRLSGMTLGSLRLWELIFFATHAVTSGLNRFEALTAPIAGAAQGVPTLAVGFSGLRSLQGFVILTLAYGALIPNTWRRSLTTPVVFIEATLAHKKEVMRHLATRSLFGDSPPVGQLRAVKVIQNRPAKQVEFKIPTNMQVPSKSVISRLFEANPQTNGDGQEDLSQWESKGRSLERPAVAVEARKVPDRVIAIVQRVEPIRIKRRRSQAPSMFSE